MDCDRLDPLSFVILTNASNQILAKDSIAFIDDLDQESNEVCEEQTGVLVALVCLTNGLYIFIIMVIVLLAIALVDSFTS